MKTDQVTDLEKRVSAKRVILTSFSVDLLDVILSLTVAILTGSVVMLSELLEGVADLVASGLLIIGLNLSSTVGSEAWNSRDLKSRPH